MKHIRLLPAKLLAEVLAHQWVCVEPRVPALARRKQPGRREVGRVRESSGLAAYDADSGAAIAARYHGTASRGHCCGTKRA